MQLPELFRIDRRGRIGHLIGRGGRFGEGDHLTNRRFSGEQRTDAIQTQCDATVGRRAVLQRLEEEPEAKLGFLVLGPMFDLKLLMMYTRVFRPRLIVTIFTSVTVLTLILCLIVHVVWSMATPGAPPPPVSG